MPPKLYIWVEASPDEAFFRRIIIPVISNNYVPRVIKGKSLLKKSPQFLRSIEKVGDSYIFVTDLNKGTPCVSERKSLVQLELPDIDRNKIIVVVTEIEGWYLAGLNRLSIRRLNVSAQKLKSKSLDSITKQEFLNIIPKGCTELQFRQKILRYFDINVAILKNKSFKYFFDKYMWKN